MCAKENRQISPKLVPTLLLIKKMLIVNLKIMIIFVVPKMGKLYRF